MGLVKMIWFMSYANSRAAAELTNAVTISSVTNQKIGIILLDHKRRIAIGIADGARLLDLIGAHREHEPAVQRSL